MIITDGYSNLSISKLTSEINISKGSFYTYFSSKDKMLGKILDEYIENTKIFTNNLLNIPKNLDECLDYYINSVLNLTDDELKLELVMVNLRRNYEVFNEENFIKLKKVDIIVILHDINLAIRYADHIVILSNDGKLYNSGEAKKVITEKMLREVYGVSGNVILDDENKPIISVKKSIINK